MREPHAPAPCVPARMASYWHPLQTNLRIDCEVAYHPRISTCPDARRQCRACAGTWVSKTFPLRVDTLDLAGRILGEVVCEAGAIRLPPATATKLRSIFAKSSLECSSVALLMQSQGAKAGFCQTPCLTR